MSELPQGTSSKPSLFAIYKPGQGKWSRGVGAASLAAIGIWSAIETNSWMVDYTGRSSGYIGYILPAVFLVIFLVCAWLVANRPGTTDFIIETEIEMKKVTWPTTREVMSATVVVIIVTIVLGLYMFGVDRGLIQPIFEAVGILPK